MNVLGSVAKKPIWWLIFLVVFSTGCGKQSVQSPVKEGGFYNGDNLPDATPEEGVKMEDAIVRHEPLSRTGNKPYTVLGKSYRPLSTSKGYVARGVASWYGKKFHGRPTSSGEIYDMWAMSAAHTTLPLPTFVQVTNLENGKKVIVKVNDRGPFLHNRIIDLSYAAALKLGVTEQGTAKVEVLALDPDHYANQRPENPDSGANAKSTQSGSGVSTDGGVKHYVQVGAYAVFQNALDMRKTLTELGFVVFPKYEQEQKDAGLPFRVRVGPFTDLEKAMIAKSKLERQFNESMPLISH